MLRDSFRLYLTLLLHFCLFLLFYLFSIFFTHIFLYILFTDWRHLIELRWNWKSYLCFSSAKFSSVAQSCLTLCNPMNCSTQASLSITNSRSSLRLTSIESMMPSSHLILYRLCLLLLPIPPSIRVFSNESTLCMMWPKYWSFSFSIIPSK